MKWTPALALLIGAGAAYAHADDLKAVVDRYVAWRGGAAFERLQSFHLKGVLDTAGLSGTEEMWADRSGRQRVDNDLGVVNQTQVTAPGRSWETTPNGQVESLSLAALQSLSRDAALQFAEAPRGREGIAGGAGRARRPDLGRGAGDVRR